MAKKYVLPVADKYTLGGVKIGDYIIIKEDGAIDVDLKSIQDEIQSSINKLEEMRILLATAISERGVPTSPDDSFQTMANNIGKISVEGASHNMYLV